MANRVKWMVGLGAALVAMSAAQVRASSIPVVVNGSPLSTDALMIQNAGRTVLPMRTLFEALGAHVEWDPTERAVYVWRVIETAPVSVSSCITGFHAAANRPSPGSARICASTIMCCP